MTIDLFRKQLQHHLKPFYSKNDDAHQEPHFEEVFTTAKVLRNYLNLPYRDELLLATAYVHDIFTGEDRENHHTLSSDFVRERKLELLELVLTSEELWLLEYACLEHRASYEGGFTSRYSQLFNAADRGRPLGWKDLFDRSVAYRSTRDTNQVIPLYKIHRDVIDHLADKFSTKGYARYPDMYMRVFGDDLYLQQRHVDELVEWFNAGKAVADFYPYYGVKAPAADFE